MVSGIGLLKCSNMAAPYLASMWSATVASPRRKAAADRTRGAWPQRVRALAEKTSIVVWNVAGAKTLPVKKVDGRAMGCEATLKIQGLAACCGESQPTATQQEHCNITIHLPDVPTHRWMQQLLTPQALVLVSLQRQQSRQSDTAVHFVLCALVGGE
jgi:hypothetical protein